MLWPVILLILGAAMTLFPRQMWRIEHIFSIKNGEPTDLYLAMMRMGGIFFMIAAVVCAIIA